MNRRHAALWLARLALVVVFFFNVGCAILFVARPEAYAPSFEVDGVVGAVLVRGIGILFLMWNVTYPLAIWSPWRYRWLFLIILVQQAIGLVGESWMVLTLPPGHGVLANAGQRFIVFDGGGLVVMAVTFALIWLTSPGSSPQPCSSLGPHAAEPALFGSPDAGCGPEEPAKP